MPTRWPLTHNSVPCGCGLGGRLDVARELWKPPSLLNGAERGLKIKKSSGGIVVPGKIIISQGVGHPMSCLGVCYTNNPPKRGMYGVRACVWSNNLSSK